MLTRNYPRSYELADLQYKLKKLRLTGLQAALLVDELHDCIAESEYMEYGTVDLNDIAGRMLKEMEGKE